MSKFNINCLVHYKHYTGKMTKTKEKTNLNSYVGEAEVITEEPPYKEVEIRIKIYNRAAGTDKFTAELIKKSGIELREHIFTVMMRTREKNKMPG